MSEGGKYQVVSSGSLILDFGKWRPFQILQLINKVCAYDDNIIDYISKNLPVATRTTSGSVRVAYKDPSLQSASSQVITTDNPAFDKMMQSFYGTASLDYTSVATVDMNTRATQILQVLNAATLTPNRQAAYLAHINSFPS